MILLQPTSSSFAARLAIRAGLIAGIVLLFCVGNSGIRPVHAEGCGDSASAGAGGEKKQGKFHTEIVNGKKIIVIDTEVSVCGKVPRPSVVYVLTAKNINYEWETLKQDFMPLILDSVKKAPL